MRWNDAFRNRTRTSASIPKRLLREGKIHLIPLYALLRTSDLAREGIENSGSYGFADHIYRDLPGGRYLVGRFLDRILLRLKGARSMRNRFHHSKREIVAAARGHHGTEFRVLSVPCGIARDLVESAETLQAEDPSQYERTSFFGIDLDSRPLELSSRLAEGLARFHFIQADAFDSSAYPPDLDLIVSTGLGEFLDDQELARFYSVCQGALREGGAFVSSGMQRHRLADYLARELAEMHAHYRAPDQLTDLLSQAGFSDVTARQDSVGLQTLLVARKETQEDAS